VAIMLASQKLSLEARHSCSRLRLLCAVTRKGRISKFIHQLAASSRSAVNDSGLICVGNLRLGGLPYLFFSSL
jgi:hypothetical protein